MQRGFLTDLALESEAVSRRRVKPSCLTGFLTTWIPVQAGLRDQDSIRCGTHFRERTMPSSVNRTWVIAANQPVSDLDVIYRNLMHKTAAPILSKQTFPIVLALAAGISTQVAIAANITLSPCNCASGDRQAIQTAIDNQTSGGVIKLLPGVYTIDATLHIWKSMVFQGSGLSNTTIKATGVAAAYMVVATADNIILRYIKFDGNNLYGGGLWATKASGQLVNLTVFSNEFTNFVGKSEGPAYTSTNYPGYPTDTSLGATTCIGKNSQGWAAVAIRLDNASASSISANYISNVQGGENACGGDSIGANRGIYTTTGTANVSIADNVIRNVKGYEDGDCVEVYQASGPVTVTRNLLYGCNKRGIKVNGGNATITENFIYSEGDKLAADGDAALNGIFVAGRSNLIADNSILLKRGASGIAILNNANSGGVGIVRNNRIDMFGDAFGDVEPVDPTADLDLISKDFKSRHSCSWNIPTSPTNGCTVGSEMPIRGIQYLESGVDLSMVQINTVFSNKIGIGSIGANAFNNKPAAGNILVAPNMIEASPQSINYRGETDYLGFYRFNHSSNVAVNYPFAEQPHASRIGNSVYTTGVVGLAIYMQDKNASIDFSINPGMVLRPGRTLSFWVMPTVDVGSGSHPFYPGLFSSSLSGNWDDYISFNKNADGSASVVLEGVNGALVSSDTISYTKNKWIHVAISISAAGQPSFYVNGEFKGTRTGTVDAINLKYLNRGYAGSLDAGGQPVIFDEIMLVNRVLSGAELAAENLKGLRAINR